MSEFNADILGRLTEATATELNQALAAIRQDAAAFEGATPTAEVLASVTGLQEAANAIRGELTSRAALADETASALAALSDLTAESPAPEQEPVEVPEPRPEPPVEPDNSPGDGADGDDTTPEEGAPVTADGRRKMGATNTGRVAHTAPVRPQVHYRTTAAVGLSEIQPGAQLDRQGLAAAFANRLQSIGRASHPGTDRYTIATVRADYPEERFLQPRVSAFENLAKMEAVVDAARGTHAAQNSLTAAGLCAPIENLYDIRTVGDTGRPIRDALVRFGTSRGGVQYRPALNGVGQTGGIGVWTIANDEADPLVPKTCVEIDCPGLEIAEIEAIYQCLTFSNMSTRFDPEFMDSVVRAQRIAHDRFAENRLYGQIIAGSKQIVGPAVLLGAVRDILVTLDKMIAYFKNVHRLADDAALRLILPLWAKNLMRADMTRQMVGDGTQVLHMTDAAINQFFTDRNVNITWHLDGIDPADIIEPDPDVVVPAQFYTTLVTGGSVPGFPDAISSLLFQEGDWMYLDGGTLDLGVVRDSTLIGENRFQTFSESFEMPFFRGIESFHLVMPVQPRGASAATVSTAAVVD
jgi:hypothetical protein